VISPMYNDEDATNDKYRVMKGDVALNLIGG
jgi:hypothetical protein